MLEFQLTPDDYVAALQTHTQWTRTRLLRFAVITIGMIVLVAFQMQDAPLWFGLALFGIYASAIVLVLVLMRYWYLPWQGRRIFAQTKALQRPYHWTWNDEQLNFSTDLASAIVPWADLVKWTESKDLFLLYPSNVTFHMFPKRAFRDAAAADAFRKLLQTKIRSPSPPQAAF